MILNKVKAAASYYLWASFRRKKLDKLQNKYKSLYHGIVLDIGGRDRGKFKKPKNKVEKWIFADIEEKHNPDIIIDVANMNNLNDESIDIINAAELFEHVKMIERGINECYRVLKKNGIFIISAPFLYPIHADPCDYQRWTEEKWKSILIKDGFSIEKIETLGFFFTVLADMMKTLNKAMPPIIKQVSYIFIPLLDLLTKLDSSRIIKKHPVFSKYTTGYFIIARK